MKSLLPVILVILLLTGAITYSLSKRAIPSREVNRFGIPANKLETNTTDTSKTSSASKFGFGSVSPTPSTAITTTPTPVKNPAILPTVTEDGSVQKQENKTDKTAQKTASEKVVKTTKTVVCTPVYGQANTCTEHIVVDTAGPMDTLFFNFAGLAYVGGLASFIKAKSYKDSPRR